MPLGFSGGNWLAQMGERYGDKLARGIVQTGAIIEENLMKMQTNRQLAGLGASLSSLNPQSADYPNKLIELGTAFPMAMQDRRGQFLMSIGAKANAEWQAQERAKAQSQMVFDRQKSLLDLRNRYRPNNEVDLLGGGGLPTNDPLQTDAPVDSAPPMAGAFGLASGMPALGAAMNVAPQPQQAAPQAAAEAPVDGTSALMGMSGNLAEAAAAPLPAGSSANRAAIRDKENSLLGRALGPLREAQRLTGKKPTQSQVASAIAAEKRAEQSAAMQEDRQRQQEAMTAKRIAEADAAAEARAARTEAAADRRFTMQDLQNHRRAAVSALTRATKAFEDSFNAEEEKGGDEQYFKLRKRLQDEQVAAQKELEAIDAEIGGTLKKESKPLSRDEAAAILREAGGDKEKARAIARERGYTL